MKLLQSLIGFVMKTQGRCSFVASTLGWMKKRRWRLLAAAKLHFAKPSLIEAKLRRVRYEVQLRNQRKTDLI